MIRRKNRFVELLKPLSIMLLLFSIFGTVWLRSGIVSLEYRLSRLENKKKELMRDTKVMLAERANLLSVERFEKVAMDGTGFTFPDRVRVVFVKKANEQEPHKTSLLASEK